MSSASPKPAKSEEPTMEEILASIRRIIADDQASTEQPEDEDTPSQPDEPEESAEPEDDDGPNSQAAVDDMFGDAAEDEQGGAEDEEEDDVLDLGAVAEPVARARHEPSPLDLEHEDIDFRDAVVHDQPDLEPEPEPEPEAHVFDVPEPDFPEPEPEFDEPEPFVAPPPPPEPPPRRGFDEERLLSDATDAAVGGSFNMLAHAVLSNQGRTLEDLVKEMLRPMLKDWLDDNLPGIVERLVRAEIERVSRGR